MIVAPNSRVVAGPMGAEEGILYAECNLEVGINMKLRHDFAGHYNRPDIFQLHINCSAPRIYTVYGSNEAPALGAAAVAPGIADTASPALGTRDDAVLPGERPAQQLPDVAASDFERVKRK